jgi:hypothetical protein
LASIYGGKSKKKFDKTEKITQNIRVKLSRARQLKEDWGKSGYARSKIGV